MGLRLTEWQEMAAASSRAQTAQTADSHATLKALNKIRHILRSHFVIIVDVRARLELVLQQDAHTLGSRIF